MHLGTGGLRSRKFVSFIEQCDIIGIQESKLDDVDNVIIPGYQVCSNYRAAVSRYSIQSLKTADSVLLSVHER